MKMKKTVAKAARKTAKKSGAFVKKAVAVLKKAAAKKKPPEPKKPKQGEKPTESLILGPHRGRR